LPTGGSRGCRSCWLDARRRRTRALSSIMDEPSMTTSASGEEIITLNVGGQIFQTTSTTVLMGTCAWCLVARYRPHRRRPPPDEQSMLAAMFGSRNHKPRVIDGAYFIDRGTRQPSGAASLLPLSHHDERACRSGVLSAGAQLPPHQPSDSRPQRQSQWRAGRGHVLWRSVDGRCHSPDAGRGSRRPGSCRVDTWRPRSLDCEFGPAFEAAIARREPLGLGYTSCWL